MTTQDLQRTDELVRAADMAVRASSQLRLWTKRRTIVDIASLDFAIQFLEEASKGGNFLRCDGGGAGISSLEPLTWTADLRFGSSAKNQEDPKIDYAELVIFVDGLRNTIRKVREGEFIDSQAVDDASSFLRQLGKHLGELADTQLRVPSSRYFLAGERYSSQ